MAETPEDAGAAGTEASPDSAGDRAQTAPQPPLVVHSQYIKDLSFEAPATPSIFGLMGNQKPNIDVNVGVEANHLAENHYEVVLQIRSRCLVAENVAFLVELTYGGVFAINVTEELLRPVLLIECPRMLFPFARHIVANATRDGGFMPLMLGPVDFVALYQNQNRPVPPEAEAESTPSATA